MSDENDRIPPTRMATAIAVSLMLSLGSPVAAGTGSENEPKEVLGDEDRKKRKKRKADAEPDPEAKSRGNTARVKATLPDIGGDDGAAAKAEKHRKRADTVATGLAQVARNVAASQQPGQPAGTRVEDQLIQQAGQAINAGLAAGVGAASKSDNPWVRNLTGTVSYGKQGVDLNLVTVASILSRESGHNLLGQAGLHNEQDRATANVGLVYRYLTPQHQALIGASLFYDHGFWNAVQRIGAGVEAVTAQTRFHVNVYAPLSDRWFDVKGNEDLQERPASGHDAGFTWSPVSVPGLDLQFGGARWRGERVDVFGTGQVLADPTVWKASVGYTPVPLLGVSVDHERAAGGPSDTRLALNFKYDFGAPMSAQVDRRNVAQRNDLASRATAPVEREHRIVMEQRDKWAPLSLAGGSLVQATIREDETYRYTLQPIGGKPPFVFVVSGADAAAFSIDGTTLRFDPKLVAPPKDGEDSLYEAIVRVSDGRGGNVQQAFVIEVVWLDPDKDGLDSDREQELGTDPQNPDTDGDGLPDGEEVANGTDPLDPNDPGAATTIESVHVLMDDGRVGGSPIVGTTLAASIACAGGKACPATVRYQWEIETAPGSRTYVDIAGATASTYTVENTDQRRRIRVKAWLP